MEEFVVGLKKRILTAFGVLNPKLSSNEDLEFDMKICELAADHIKTTTGLNHFNYLFECESEYSKIAYKTGIADDQ